MPARWRRCWRSRVRVLRSSRNAEFLDELSERQLPSYAGRSTGKSSRTEKRLANRRPVFYLGRHMRFANDRLWPVADGRSCGLRSRPYRSRCSGGRNDFSRTVEMRCRSFPAPRWADCRQTDAKLSCSDRQSPQLGDGFRAAPFCSVIASEVREFRSCVVNSRFFAACHARPQAETVPKETK